MRFLEYLVEAHDQEQEDVRDTIHTLQIQKSAVQHAIAKYRNSASNVLAEIRTNPHWMTTTNAPNSFLFGGWSWVMRTPETLEAYSRFLIAERNEKKWMEKLKKIKANLVDAKKAHTSTQHTARAQNRKTLVRIDDKDVPQYLPLTKGATGIIENPYRLGVNPYAGHPDGFVFWPELREHFEMLEFLLEKANLPGFTMLYGSDVSSPKLGKTQRFVVVGADGNFVWTHNVKEFKPLNSYFVKGAGVEIDVDAPETVAMVKTKFPEYQK